MVAEKEVNCRGAKEQGHCLYCRVPVLNSTCPAFDSFDIRCRYSSEHRPGRSRSYKHFDCAATLPPCERVTLLSGEVIRVQGHLCPEMPPPDQMAGKATYHERWYNARYPEDCGRCGASVGERCFTSGGRYRGQPHKIRRVATVEGGEFYRRWVEFGGKLNDLGGPAYFYEFPPYPGWQDDYVWDYHQRADYEDAQSPRCEMVTLPSGETLRVQGHLSPEGVEALGRVVDAVREEFAGLTDEEFRDRARAR